MSPNEDQLRAALRHGQGDAPDATALISHAIRVRHDRHRRRVAIAGGVAIVAVLGVGTTALVSSRTGGGTNGSAGSSADLAGGGTAQSGKIPGAKAPAGQPSSAGASSPIRATSTAHGADELTCPAAPARYMLPGGGGSGQFGSTDPLFPSAVTALKACGYAAGAGAQPRAHVYQSPVSTRIVAALESAPTTRSTHMCADNTYVRGTIEILAVDARGRALTPVVLTLNCQASEATNGTAVRYVNAVPDELVALVH